MGESKFSPKTSLKWHLYYLRREVSVVSQVKFARKEKGCSRGAGSTRSSIILVADFIEEWLSTCLSGECQEGTVVSSVHGQENLGSKMLRDLEPKDRSRTFVFDHWCAWGTKQVSIMRRLKWRWGQILVVLKRRRLGIEWEGGWGKRTRRADESLPDRSWRLWIEWHQFVVSYRYFCREWKVSWCVQQKGGLQRNWFWWQ